MKRENVKPIKKMIGPFAPEVAPRRNPTRSAASQIVMVLLAFMMGATAQYGWAYLHPDQRACKV